MGIFIYQLNVGDLYIIVNVCEGKVTVAGSAVSGSLHCRVFGNSGSTGIAGFLKIT